jgi:putative transposase
VFTAPDVVALAQEQILTSALRRGFAILAYVFMPDHMHLLAEGTREDSSMTSFCDLAKQKSAYEHSRKYQTRLWQPSYHDRVLRNEDATWDVIRYIVNNPVRANLVVDYRDYPYFGSGVMSREELIRELASREVRPWQP